MKKPKAIQRKIDDLTFGIDMLMKVQMIAQLVSMTDEEWQDYINIINEMRSKVKEKKSQPPNPR